MVAAEALEAVAVAVSAAVFAEAEVVEEAVASVAEEAIMDSAVDPVRPDIITAEEERRTFTIIREAGTADMVAIPLVPLPAAAVVAPRGALRYL